jgi:hypothetical protein
MRKRVLGPIMSVHMPPQDFVGIKIRQVQRGARFAARSSAPVEQARNERELTARRCQAKNDVTRYRLVYRETDPIPGTNGHCRRFAKNR